jgi:hypothetical protein
LLKETEAIQEHHAFVEEEELDVDESYVMHQRRDIDQDLGVVRPVVLKKKTKRPGKSEADDGPTAAKKAKRSSKGGTETAKVRVKLPKGRRPYAPPVAGRRLSASVSPHCWSPPAACRTPKPFPPQFGPVSTPFPFSPVTPPTVDLPLDLPLSAWPHPTFQTPRYAGPSQDDIRARLKEFFDAGDMELKNLEKRRAEEAKLRKSIWEREKMIEEERREKEARLLREREERYVKRDGLDGSS